MDLWMVGAAANAVTAIAYLAIATAIMVPLVRERQVLSNRMGTATAVIFLTCAVHHGGHTWKAVVPFLGLWQSFGWDQATGIYTRLAWDSEAVAWDVITAAVGIYYWSLRRHYAPLMRGAKLFEDLRERQRQAMQLNDDVVQGMAAAKMCLELGDGDQALKVLDTSLAKARGIVSDLLQQGAAGSVGPGDLTRDTAAVVSTA